MLKYTSLLLGAAVIGLPAMADEGGETAPVSAIIIDQVQLGDVWSGMVVAVPDYTSEAVATSTAVGNAAAGQLMSGDILVALTQRLNGDVTAQNELSGYSAGTAIVATTSYGNSTTAGTWAGSNDYETVQTSNGDVVAVTQIALDGASQITSSTTAMANVSVPENEYGTNDATQTQISNGSVSANTDVDMCCDSSSATFATTAGGNAVSSTGWTSSNFVAADQVTAAGETIQASTDVYMEDGHDVLAATTSFGNSVTTENQWGYATLGLDGAPITQDNASDVDSQTYVTLDHWSGYATSSAYGVGNSSLISNLGSDTALYTSQNNDGDVSSSADLTGNSSVGGTGIVTATSIGNAATATLCNFCGEENVLSGGIQQVNSGQVTAQGTAYTPNSGMIQGSATAVGNSATFQTYGH